MGINTLSAYLLISSDSHVCLCNGMYHVSIWDFVLLLIFNEFGVTLAEAIGTTTEEAVRF